MSLTYSKSDGERERKVDSESSGSNYEDRKARLIELLMSSVEGRTKETVRSDNEFMLEGIKGVPLSAFVNSRFSKKDNEVRAFALALCQSIKQMLDFGGKELNEIVDINFDVSGYVIVRRDEIAVLDKELESLDEVIDEEVRQPNRQEDLEDRLELRLADEKASWTKKGKGRGKAETPAKTPPIPPDTDAHEKIDDAQTQTDAGWEAFKSRVRLELLREFGNAQEKFRAHEVSKKAALRKRNKIVDAKNREVLLQTRLKGYQSAVSTIYNRMKNVISECVEVKRTVSMRVKILTSGEEISDPWYVGNLTGVRQLLMIAYNKASLVTFSQTMLSTISYKCDATVCNNEPLKVVQGVSRLLNLWELMGYYVFMTKDVFFTAILINSFTDGCAIKEKLILRAAERMREMDSASVEADDLAGVKKDEMLLYNDISDYVKMLQESMVKVSAVSGGSAPTHVAPKKQFEVRAKIAEGAAVAQGGEGGDTSKEKRKFFKAPVTREQNVTVQTRSGESIVYSATREACNACAHNPRCKLSLCFKCGMFGHIKIFCRQDRSTYVSRQSGAAAVDYGAMADEGSDNED